MVTNFIFCVIIEFYMFSAFIWCAYCTYLSKSMIFQKLMWQKLKYFNDKSSLLHNNYWFYRQMKTKTFIWDHTGLPLCFGTTNQGHLETKMWSDKKNIFQNCKRFISSKQYKTIFCTITFWPQNSLGYPKEGNSLVTLVVKFRSK